MPRPKAPEYAPGVNIWSACLVIGHMKAAGEPDSARNMGKISIAFSIIGLVLGTIGIIIYVVLHVVAATHVKSTHDDMFENIAKMHDKPPDMPDMSHVDVSCLALLCLPTYRNIFHLFVTVFVQKFLDELVMNFPDFDKSEP